MSLVLVLIAAMGVVYFVFSGEEEYDAPPPGPTIISLVERTEGDVVSVTFLGGKRDYTIVPRETAAFIIDWYWEAEPDFVVNSMNMRDKARIGWHLNAASIAHGCSLELDLAEFGLAPADFTIHAIYTDGTYMNIYIGAQTADRRGYFVKVSNDTAIYTLDNFMVDRAMQGMEGVLSRSLPSFGLGAEYIVINQYGRPTIELWVEVPPWQLDDAMAALVHVTPEQQVLRMIQPLPNRALDHTRLSMEVLDPLGFLRLTEVVSLLPDSLASYGLYSPTMEFIYRDETTEIHLQFGNTFFEDVNGIETQFVYVKFADRPHVFRAEFSPAAVLYDIGIFSFVESFVFATFITEVQNITISSQNISRNFEMVINHGPDATIAPTINGQSIIDSDFRLVYRLLIALQMETEVEHVPIGEPAFTVTYHMINSDDVELRFFAVDANFYAISINGADAWFATHARDVSVVFDRLESVMP